MTEKNNELIEALSQIGYEIEQIHLGQICSADFSGIEEVLYEIRDELVNIRTAVEQQRK
jgi:hypothetical protein